MTIQLSMEQARNFLTRYHFQETDLPGVVQRLGTIQYDPLNPVGRNADLVLQARVPGYRIDDWQKAAYQDRALYDSWDKQACLVQTADWPLRHVLREMYRPYHDHEILQADPGTAARILAAIDSQGPLSSLEFEDRLRIAPANSWSGATRTKRVLRALWVCGLLLTHHRKSGRHYYDRPERVIPEPYISEPLLTDKAIYHRWILGRRFQAVGLLRASAEACIWSGCGESAVRKEALAQLVAQGELTPATIEGRAWSYYIPTNLLPLLNAPTPEARMIFVGPLDSILWDRKAVQHLFSFDYTWEVYKPLAQRKWGYYVLPVFYKNRFIARIDSRLEQGVWKIANWWWEEDTVPDAELLAALQQAASRFLGYLGAQTIQVHEQVEASTRTTLLSIAPTTIHI